MPKIIHKSQREGLIFNSVNYGSVKIIKYKKWNDITIKFLNTGTIVTHVKFNHIAQGRVKDPLLPNVFGIGFIGQNHIYARNTKEYKAAYKIWHGMLLRVYYSGNPAYSDVKVARRWHNFSNFLYDVTKMPNWINEGFELDKDLRKLGNRIYSRKYCSFVPKIVNSLFTHTSQITKMPRGLWKNGNSNFAVQLQMGGYQKYLGTYPTKKIAHKVYCKAKAKRVRKIIKIHKEVLHPEIVDNFCNVKSSYFSNL